MVVSLNDFQQIANSTYFGRRDVVFDAQSSKVKLGGFVFSSGATANKASMQAFREALANKYGVFGEHAFDTVLGNRSQMRKSLRACDITATLSKLESLKEKRFINEIARQLDTDPKFLKLSPQMRSELKNIIFKSPTKHCDLTQCQTQTELAQMAAQRLNDGLELLESEISLGKMIDKTKKELKTGSKVEENAKSDQATGLNNLKLVFKKNQTSIEDKIKSGSLGVGMRINSSQTNPVLLDKLKTNGVEPGFIYKRDWSRDDTKGMLANFKSDESLAILDTLKKKHPSLAKECADLPIREQIMLCGRAHPAAMSAVADYVIENGMNDPNSTIYKAFCDKFPHADPDNWRDQISLDIIKTELFVEIRDTVLNTKTTDPAYKMSPIFKHFNDRHIVKLDYNESTQIFGKNNVASSGKFMRPERIKVGRTAGQIYRLQTATTADKSSVGAVTEALANDLTRIIGIPSQELSIVRGVYSDGHPKIMLEAKFADGYSDMENGYIKDGQIVPPAGENVESLGKYKAFFLVTADRDAVGSRGQNKGFTKDPNGGVSRFFAIDPGHSLEGNSRYLEVSDNFDFKDTYGFSTKPRFKNFSVFDDDTRFAKFKGALDLRSLQKSGRIDKLFSDYRKAFDPNADGIDETEKNLRIKIGQEIDKKEAEFKDSLAKILTVAQNQFDLYDALAPQGPEIQSKAIETIENLEKLTSPTTWVSPKGEVPLKHLKVIPETRIPWRAFSDGDNIVYHCDQPLSKEAQTNLKALANIAGANLVIDAEGCAKLTITNANARRAFDTFDEKNVANLTHRNEVAARASGEDGLAAAKLHAQIKPAKTNTPPKAFELPETLDVRVGNDNLTFRKAQYEAMLANTPEAERPQNLDEFKKILASRIQRGRDILDAIYQGKGQNYEASLRNVACLTLALHAGTAKKGEYNARGSFSVADPDGKIYQWLDTCKETYMRTSTHAKANHNLQIDGHLNMPRGIDVPEGMGGLMGGMRTLHYFAIPHGNAGQPRRLFLKCETYGIYHSTITNKETEDSRAPGMQLRPSHSGDTSESIKHCLSLLTVVTRMGKNEGNRKENTPKQILDALNVAVRDLQQAGHADEAAILSKDVKNGGIRVMMNNLVKVLEALPNDASAQKVFQDLTTVVTTYANSDDRSGSMYGRLGNEVMLEAHEIL